MNETVNRLQGELNEKSSALTDVEKQKNDAEWSLGEHRQWLQDANDR